MKLTFLGTRGCIEECSARHARHSALLVEHRGDSVMIDCGEDWRGKLGQVDPRAIVLTHAHPDHAAGLQDGAPCPVWATQETWVRIGHYPLAERRLIHPRQPSAIGGISFEAFPVAHSLRAPAVALRIATERTAVFYAPDLADLPDRGDALRGVPLYVGDGASVRQPLLRTEGGRLCGHAPVISQLFWCSEEGVRGMIVTHCGREIVGDGEDVLAGELRERARDFGVELDVAYDGMAVMLK